jgi:hypothetical protein
VLAALAARPVLQPKSVPVAPAKAPLPNANPVAVQFKPDARGRLAPPPLPGAKSPPVQLKPSANGRLAPPPLPPRVVPGRGGPIQAKGAGDAFPLPPGFRLRTGGGQPLPPAVQAHMEGVFGARFADVRVHVGGEAPAIGALAFTHGTDVYFAPGQYQPNTPHGLRLIGHELTHVVQQRAGRVRNPLGSGVAVVQDAALEAEADQMGARVAGQRLAPTPTRRLGSIQPKWANVIQRATVSGVRNDNKTATEIGNDMHELVQSVFLSSYLARSYNLYTEAQIRLNAYQMGRADLVAVREDADAEETGEMYIYVGEIKSDSMVWYGPAGAYIQLANYMNAYRARYPYARVGALDFWNPPSEGLIVNNNGYNCRVFIQNRGAGLYTYTGRVQADAIMNMEDRLDSEEERELPFNEQPNYMFH